MDLKTIMGMDFGGVERRVLAAVAQHESAGYQGQVLGTIIHDELQYMERPAEPRDKQPWQKGYIPKQGSPKQLPPRQVEGWTVHPTTGGDWQYRRRGSDIVVKGDWFKGWRVVREVWLGQDELLVEFPKLRTATVWASLQAANEPEAQRNKRRKDKEQALAYGYGMGQSRMLAMSNPSGEDLYAKLAEYCRQDVDATAKQP